MAYARHQSFYLRDKWISKGLRAIINEPKFFFLSDGFEKIGLGKNMVQSLRFWLSAMNLIVEGKDKTHDLTPLGHLIYNKDRLLRENNTISILHYHLVRNKEDLATIFEWYYNTYIEAATQRESLLKSFTTFVKNYEGKEVSPKSLKRDVDCLVQLYTKEADETDPENFIFSPFSRLNLLKEIPSEDGKEIITKVAPNINDIGLTSLYYALISYSFENDTEMISVDEILNEKYLWGKLYNLTRNRVIEALNKLTNHDVFPIEYIRTNNLDNVRVPSISPMEYLKYEMERM
ncbi:DUF4007 family protein [Fictibacillus halophilus]|uniref:DUF4007 family protein n=1 Tax=Fictibacillus halophilus TaxID=1610490 RepID=UPI001CF94C21|nr:DUF4007 family protein [Fictibacillus halophilus]